MQSCKQVLKIEYAGSLRRKNETIGDIDLLVSSDKPADVTDFFLEYPKIKQILASGETKVSMVTEDDLQVDLRVVAPENFGAALFYFTGPKHFNIHIRTIALRRGLKVNEYGLFDGEQSIAGRAEEEMFNKLDLPYLKPEDREDFNVN